jgi:type VI protein secretion system component VasK
MSVDSTSVTWRYKGPWALLRLLGAHRPNAADLSGSPREDRATVNLRVLTRSRDATSEPQDARDATASVFLRLTFSGSPGGDLTYPRFPTRIPAPPTG